MALSLIDARVGHKPDAGHARLSGFGHYFSDHLVLRSLVGAQMQLGRRIEFSSRRHALDKQGVIDPLDISE